MLFKSDMILLANIDRDVCLLFLDKSPMASIHILSSYICPVQINGSAYSIAASSRTSHNYAGTKHQLFA